jgi:hypothetical protein
MIQKSPCLCKNSKCWKWGAIQESLCTHMYAAKVCVSVCTRCFESPPSSNTCSYRCTETFEPSCINSSHKLNAVPGLYAVAYVIITYCQHLFSRWEQKHWVRKDKTTIHSRLREFVGRKPYMQTFSWVSTVLQLSARLQNETDLQVILLWDSTLKFVGENSIFCHIDQTQHKQQMKNFAFRV